MSIVAASKSGLIASANTPEEKAAAASTLSDLDRTLVLDLTALLCLDGLELLRDGSLPNRRLAVAQTTVDELRVESIHWKSNPNDGFMSVGLHEGKLTIAQTNGEQVAENRARIARLLEWVARRCEILSVAPSIAERHATSGRLAELVGRSFWDSMLVASEGRRILLSDDLHLRTLFLSILGGESACSSLLITAEMRRGALASERFASLMLSLAQSGYRYISTDARILAEAAQREGWRAQGAFLRILDTIKGPEASADSAALVAAQFFKILWLEVILPQQRESVCIAVLDALLSGRSPREVLPHLDRNVEAFFSLLPLAIADIRRTIAAWRRLRMLP